MICSAIEFCRSDFCRRLSVILAGAVLISACGGAESSPEEQLRQWVDAGQTAVEEKKRRALLDLISPAYVDARDNDRDEIGDVMRVYFLRQNNITLLTNIEDIRVYGSSAAEIDLTVGMAGISDGVFSFSADAYRFQLELERDDDEWLLISARWAELGNELR